MRGLFAGSGSAALSDLAVVKEVVKLTGKKADIRVLYIGTATYDAAGAMQKQTSRFAELGCSVSSLNCARATPTDLEMAKATEKADVLVVSGGNTL